MTKIIMENWRRYIKEYVDPYELPPEEGAGLEGPPEPTAQVEWGIERPRQPPQGMEHADYEVEHLDTLQAALGNKFVVVDNRLSYPNNSKELFIQYVSNHEEPEGGEAIIPLTLYTADPRGFQPNQPSVLIFKTANSPKWGQMIVPSEEEIR